MHDELYTWEVIIACIHAFDRIQIYLFPKNKFLSYTKYILGLGRLIVYPRYIPGIYHVKTFSGFQMLFFPVLVYYMHYNTVTIMILLYHDHLFFFANDQTIISHYHCIVPKRTIISQFSLMTFLLYHLFFRVCINTIIAIITLLFALFLPQTSIAIIFLDKNYFTYNFLLLLLQL